MSILNKHSIKDAITINGENIKKYQKFILMVSFLLIDVIYTEQRTGEGRHFTKSDKEWFVYLSFRCDERSDEQKD